MDIIKRILIIFHFIAIGLGIFFFLFMTINLMMNGTSFIRGLWEEPITIQYLVWFLLTLATTFGFPVLVSIIRWIVEGKFYLFPNSKGD